MTIYALQVLCSHSWRRFRLRAEKLRPARDRPFRRLLQGVGLGPREGQERSDAGQREGRFAREVGHSEKQLCLRNGKEAAATAAASAT